MTAQLCVNELGVVLGDSARLAQVSFNVQCGEIASVVGANGAGKTTLLRAIAGDFAQGKNLAGSVSFNGHAIDALSPRKRALCMAVLAQQNTLNFPFLVREVIALGRTPHDSGVDADRHIVQHCAARFDLLALLDRIYTELSGGERQRVQLARVFAQIEGASTQDVAGAAPKLLLLDEPMSALDYRHQREVAAAIVELAAQHVAVLQVMHDINLAASYSSRMLALVDGRLCCDCDVPTFMQPGMLKTVFDIDAQILRHAETGRVLIVS
ncbi:MAG: ATP-binding cassette domain-containing protein [Pseudomonadales bacterium]